MDRRAFIAGAAALGVAGCARGSWAPDDMVQRLRYRHPGPTSITLLTVRNTGSGNGAHTGLLINASQRVLFDGAGSFVHETIPERNDVIFGVNPAVLDFYIDFHTRREYYTVTQHLLLPADAAQDLLQRALVAGPVPSALCTTRTSRLLADTPGLDAIGQSFLPETLQRQFAALPGVVTKEWRDDDPDRESARLYAWAGQPSRYNVE